MGVLRVDVSVEQPLLSVIVPVYNGEKYLEATVESILNASYKKLELLLVDDGSTDSSSNICMQYMEKDRRVTYIRQENSGIVSARNRGLAKSCGTYVCFCDQDDIVAPFMYERLLDRMISCMAEIGMCSTGRIIDGVTSTYECVCDGKYEGREVREKLLYPLLFRGYRYAFAQSSNYLYGTIWKCIYNRNFLVNNRFHFRRFIDYEDDWLFVTETLCAAKKAVTDNYTGYYWRLSGDSRSHSCHFVEGMIPKMREYDSYVMNYLKTAIVDKDILKEYIRVNLCEHFVILYQNDASIPKKDKAIRRQYRREVAEYLQSVHYKDKLRCQKYLKRGMFRRRVVLGALEHFGVERTFCISRAVDWIERTFSSIQWIVMFERRLKRGKQ